VPSPRSATLDRALVLERHPFSETSLVVSVLTRRHGPLRLLARGAFRPRSRFYAVLDYFDELELSWVPARTGELHSLRSGSMLVRRKGILSDLERFEAAISLLELCSLGSRPGMPETPLFDSLSVGLDRLAQGGGAADEVRVRFELEFLRRHGLAPALQGCASCGQDARTAKGPHAGVSEGPRAHFSAGAGGRLCGPCAAEARSSGRRVGTLPLDVLESAARMLAGEEVDMPAPALARLRDFVERFLGYHLEARPRSQRAFLAHANRNAPQVSAQAGE
jgi:DNA repair protein RecO